MPKRFPVFGLFALLALVFFGGCERHSSRPGIAEIDEPEYRLGQRLVKQGRMQEALAAYLRVIEARGDKAPESHLEAGIIYLQQIKDPIAAIYHFRKYLERLPNSPQAEQVRGLVESAKREFARTLPANPMESQSERLNMLDRIDRLQRENEQLKAELALARGSSSGGGVGAIQLPTSSNPGNGGNQVIPPPQPVVSSPISLAPEAAPPSPAAIRTGGEAEPRQPPARPSQPRIHVVVRGDTLFSLAQRYYNSRSKWRDIYDANRDQLPNPNSLQIGMSLKIP